MERPWDVKETSEYTGTPEATLRWYVHRGIGPKSFKLGRRRVFMPSDVEAWVRAQYAQATGGDAA